MAMTPYYPQIQVDIRAEAAAMAPHYEMFYSLETTIRRLISDTLEAASEEDWWNSGCVPQQIKSDAERVGKRRSTVA